MRVIYGAFAQGQGHFSKAAVLIPLLEANGHTVHLVSSGQLHPPTGYRFAQHTHYPGLAYAVTNGQTDFQATFKNWLSDLPKVFQHLWRLRSLIRKFQPDVILTDFEPLTASPLIDPPCEVISVCRQNSLLDRSITLPDGMSFKKQMARSIFRFFTAGAHRRFGFHYQPASFRSLPPIIRPELAPLQPEAGEHLLIYNQYSSGAGGSFQELHDWAAKRGQRVIAYGFNQIERGEHGNVSLRAASRTQLLEDLRTCRAVITTSGFTTPIEAALLGKPVGVVPIPNHWEQKVNAHHLEHAGLAVSLTEWNFDQFLKQMQPVTDTALLDWLRTPAEQVLAHLLGQNQIAQPAAQQTAISEQAA